MTTCCTIIISLLTHIASIKGFDKLATSVEENIVEVMLVFTLESLMVMFISCLVHFYEQDFISSNSENLILQQKQRVLENLHEAIVCKSKEGISYCNDQGFTIIQNICQILHHRGQPDQEVL